VEEVCTCKICKLQNWIIYKDRMECENCGKTYKWSVLEKEHDDFHLLTKAQDLVNLTNDNY
jgi:hypothetical protein